MTGSSFRSEDPDLRRLLPSLLLLTACSASDAPAPAPAEVIELPAEAHVEADRPKTLEEAIAEMNEEFGEQPRKRRKPPIVEGGDPSEQVVARKLDRTDPELALLVVLDTVRADRTHLCGYDKPNTPNLDRLAMKGASKSCTAYAPGPWTLPSHASMFTGQPTAIHGVHAPGSKLPDDMPTVAELFRARGYQTVFVSANPVFQSADAGFWRGFDRVVSATGLSGPLRNQGFAKHIEEELERVDRNRPLLLVVNIFDAHDPYPAIPVGVPWAAPQDEVDLLPHTADPSNPYYRFVTGEMPAEQAPGYVQEVQDAYDHAISVADRNLGALMSTLGQEGWLKKRRRIVVTSDHGEHLGEHDLLRHGSATWETVTRVPFLYKDSRTKEPLELPEVVTTTDAFHLLLNGALPAKPSLVQSASANNPKDFKPSWPTVSVWTSPTDKLMWFDGAWRRYDLAKDPGELKPGELDEGDAGYDVLAARVQAHTESLEAVYEDPAVMEMLKAVGYVQ